MHNGNNGWLRKLVTGTPHQIIGGEDRPYLKRWYLIPRNPVLNIYLHQFLRSDDDRALHDHPWWFASLILKGGYWEHRAGKTVTAKSFRSAGSLAFRRPSAAHRVELEPNVVACATFNGVKVTAREGERPAWTLIVTGPRVRPWGFHCPKGWVHWEKFTHQNGCGEYA